jgi:hypothetical protein
MALPTVSRHALFVEFVVFFSGKTQVRDHSAGQMQPLASPAQAGSRVADYRPWTSSLPASPFLPMINL